MCTGKTFTSTSTGFPIHTHSNYIGTIQCGFPIYSTGTVWCLQYRKPGSTIMQLHVHSCSPCQHIVLHHSQCWTQTYSDPPMNFLQRRGYLDTLALPHTCITHVTNQCAELCLQLQDAAGRQECLATEL